MQFDIVVYFDFELNGANIQKEYFLGQS